ncbi:hypothetical protein RIF29_09953 [Crotalaria pallida]|uniref:Uncharacterized protein n=1 Tax=Crotalaria pallida TaxID=3830 RepID=A0AAN9FVG8_CROPI
MMSNGLRGEKAEIRTPESIPTSPKRSNRLHNFNLPDSLKWGGQRHLRCANPSSVRNNFFGSGNEGSSASRINDYDGGIEAISKKLTNDLKNFAEKMKNEMPMNTEKEEKEKEEGEISPDVMMAMEGVNLLNQRAEMEEFKVPVGVKGKGKGLKIDEKKANGSSSMKNNNKSSGTARIPNLRRNSEKVGSRKKFSLTLTKKEIEEDFLAMTGHKPLKKPTKRPKAVQKQMDDLYPGLWLTEVNANSYKVREAPITNKARKGKGKMVHLSESEEEKP